MTINDGGPAFPVAMNEAYTGMTLRQWYAGQAMAGMLASSGSWDFSGAASDALNYADAMIAHEAEERAEKEAGNG